MSTKLIYNIMALSLFLAASSAFAKATMPEAALYSIPVKTIEGKATTLKEYKGKVLLVVNTASECGFTPQYKGLEALFQAHKSQGLVVLGFPSNDFGGQEPGAEAEIKKFCELKYKTTFPLFSKVKVKESPDPIYAHLQTQADEKVQWNFGKFLISRQGKVIQYFPSKVAPDSPDLLIALEKALKED